MGARVDLDKATERAWRQLQLDLAQRIADLEEGEVLLLELEVPECEEVCAPYVQVVTSTPLHSRVEAVSNHYLSLEYRLDKAARRALRALGWEKPDDRTENYWLDIERGDEVDAQDAAGMMVRALREVYGVPHPAFLLDWADLADDDEDVERGEEPLTIEAGRATTPIDAAHLHRLVTAALAEDLGQEPRTDDDNDFPFICGQSVVFVSVIDGPMPVIRIFARLVEDVTERDRAAYEVAVLNRDFRWAKFVLVDDAVLLRSEIPANPFAPHHLSFVLAEICDWVCQHASDTAYRAGGRCFLEEPTEEAR